MRLVKKAMQDQMPQEKTSPFGILSTEVQSSSSAHDTSAVHPQISQVLLFQEEAILNDDKYAPSSEHVLRKVNSLKHVHFENLLNESKSESLVVLVGAAGSGKTTCSIRLAKAFNQESKNLCFRLEFKELADKEDLTLRDLLLKTLNLKEFIKADPKLRGKKCRNERQQRIDDTKDDAYTWTEDNVEHVLLIIDGYDQFPPGIKEIPPKKDSDSKMGAADLIASVCNGDFLNGCRVILTSRSHALDSLPVALKKKATTYLLQDLNHQDMMKLLQQLSGNKFDSISEALETKAPHLKSICCNPLLLQMYVAAASSDDPKNVTSMTRIFKSVINRLRVSKTLHTKSLTNEEIEGLSEVAYEAINEGSVLINKEKLKNKGLEPKDVQGFIFIVPGSDDDDNVDYLIDGKHQLYFSHQTLQEYFAARYICKHMKDDQFTYFVLKKLCDKHWFVVAQFLCGMVVDLKESGG